LSHCHGRRYRCNHGRWRRGSGGGGDLSAVAYQLLYAFTVLLVEEDLRRVLIEAKAVGAR